MMSRGGLLNLGFRILPSKLASDTPMLGLVWTDSAETVGQESTKFQPNWSTES